MKYIKTIRDDKPKPEVKEESRFPKCNRYVFLLDSDEIESGRWNYRKVRVLRPDEPIENIGELLI